VVVVKAALAVTLNIGLTDYYWIISDGLTG